MKFDNLLRYAFRILDSYSGETPLAGWLKQYFRENPQMGSHDRKQVSEMTYSYFRLGHALKNISVEDRILSGLFLSHPNPEPLLEYFRPEWNTDRGKPLEEKLLILRKRFPEFEELEIFPWPELLSGGINHRALCLSYLCKPPVFLRVRPGREDSVRQKLTDRQIPFRNADPDSTLPFTSLSMDTGVKLDEVLKMNNEAVVQDLGSQHTALVMKPDGKKEFEAWDCCAGSGGKAILLQDLFPECKLTVSDIRDSILKNLTARFRDAGIRPNQMFQADLTDGNDLPRQSYNYILADLPCSGSGTWGRTPESLYFFDTSSISIFGERQKKILSNISGRLKPGGILVYITCSVFSAENEAVVSMISESQREMEKTQEKMYPGYEQLADSLFTCRFKKRG